MICFGSTPSMVSRGDDVQHDRCGKGDMNVVLSIYQGPADSHCKLHHVNSKRTWSDKGKNIKMSACY
jgi:hypothetical protein